MTTIRKIFVSTALAAVTALSCTRALSDALQLGREHY